MCRCEDGYLWAGKNPSKSKLLELIDSVYLKKDENDVALPNGNLNEDINDDTKKLCQEMRGNKRKDFCIPLTDWKEKAPVAEKVDSEFYYINTAASGSLPDGSEQEWGELYDAEEISADKKRKIRRLKANEMYSHAMLRRK